LFIVRYSTKKGWFRKPDWEMAAQYFEKAGKWLGDESLLD
jgi:hypothetical protein